MTSCIKANPTGKDWAEIYRRRMALILGLTVLEAHQAHERILKELLAAGAAEEDVSTSTACTACTACCTLAE